MDSENKLDMVDRYLLGQMSQEEIGKFEQLLLNDNEIKSLVEDQRKLIKGMEKYQEKAEFFDMLQDIKKEEPEQNIVQLKQTEPAKEETGDRRNKIRPLRHKLAYAAGLALLVTAILFILDTRADPESLVANHFSFHPDVMSAQLAASGATDDVNKEFIPLLRSGIELYNNQEYVLAQEQFRAFATQSKGRNYLDILNDFYIAQIALDQNQPKEAIALLSPILDERGLPIEAATRWYLALAYLRNDEAEKGIELMEELQTHRDYGSQASKILKKIK